MAISKYTRKIYTVAELAYLAGILDGEGCFNIGRYSVNPKTKTPHYQCFINVTSTDEILIDWLVSHFGGWKGKKTPNQTAKNARRVAFGWQCTGDRLEHLCEVTLPYLVIKKPQAELMLEMRKTFNGSQHKKKMQGVQPIDPAIIHLRETYFLKLRSLHNRK